LDGRSGGIESVIDERARDTIHLGKRQSRMHEYDALAAVELHPQRLEGRVAEVFFGIVAEENNPVSP
jgi:hypothetical protein